MEIRPTLGVQFTQPSNVALDNIAGVLNSLDSVVDALQGPSLTAIVADPSIGQTLHHALTQVDEALARVGRQRAQLGGEHTILQMLSDNYEKVSLSNQSAIIETGKLDYVKAFDEMNGYQFSLAASYKTYAKANALTLFDML